MNLLSELANLLQYRISAARPDKDTPSGIRDLFQSSCPYDEGYEDSKNKILTVKKGLLQNRNFLEVNDLGAGPGASINSKRRICDIAGKSGQAEKYEKLQYRILRKYQPLTILELGTSFGFSTALFAMAAPEARVITIEGCGNTARVAQENFSQLGIGNITQVTGSFDDVLDSILKLYQPFDYIFFDGNHRMAPTLNYFLKALPAASEKASFFFDDIRWSDQMVSAWYEILKHPGITLSIDLHKTGLLMFDRNLPQQRLKIRY
jgi:predicted O-methyltransferase YrrM